MAEYTVKLLKEAGRRQLPPGDATAYIVARGNGITPRAVRSLSGPAYNAMQNDYVRVTLPSFYRKVEDGLERWAIYSCTCGCQCGECFGLELLCPDDCVCGEAELLGTFPRELTAGMVIDAGDDAVRLTELALGESCDDMDIARFRTLQLAIQKELNTGELPPLASMASRM